MAIQTRVFYPMLDARLFPTFAVVTTTTMTITMIITLNAMPTPAEETLRFSDKLMNNQTMI